MFPEIRLGLARVPLKRHASQFTSSGARGPFQPAPVPIGLNRFTVSHTPEASLSDRGFDFDGYTPHPLNHKPGQPPLESASCTSPPCRQRRPSTPGCPSYLCSSVFICGPKSLEKCLPVPAQKLGHR
jgi:hypothetical protein